MKKWLCTLALLLATLTLLGLVPAACAEEAESPFRTFVFDLPKGIKKACEQAGTVTREDYTTYDILKAYYQDEEEDMYWAQGQLDMIECIASRSDVLCTFTSEYGEKGHGSAPPWELMWKKPRPAATQPPELFSSPGKET